MVGHGGPVICDVTSLQPELSMTIGKIKPTGAALKVRFAQNPDRLRRTRRVSLGRVRRDPALAPALLLRSRAVDRGNAAGGEDPDRLDALGRHQQRELHCGCAEGPVLDVAAAADSNLAGPTAGCGTDQSGSRLYMSG